MTNAYWNQRFAEEGMIWGEKASPTVYEARDLFMREGVKTVLVPGAGYGRNSRELAAYFQVDAIELSPAAIELARSWDGKTRYRQGSVLERSDYAGRTYDAIYSFDLLHLFIQPERARLIDHCLHALNANGLLYTTCFSDEDEACGTGTEIEPGTFEYKPDKFAHFFSESDLLEHFAAFDVVNTGKAEEVLVYADGTSRTYRLRTLLARKK